MQKPNATGDIWSKLSKDSSSRTDNRARLTICRGKRPCATNFGYRPFKPNAKPCLLAPKPFPKRTKQNSL